MGTTNRFNIIRSPTFQVTATWCWNFIGNFLIMALAMLFLSANLNISRQTMQANPSLALIPIVAELITAGLLPVVFTMSRRESPAIYGLQKQGLGISLLLSLIILIFYAVFVYLGIERFYPIHLADLQISSIWQLLSAMLAILAYGPLEVFFVIWLIYKTDRIFHCESQVLSKGLLLTMVIYGLLHAFSQGYYALFLAARYFAFGLIYKATHNSIAPMLAGTVTNEYIWYLVNVLL